MLSNPKYNTDSAVHLWCLVHDNKHLFTPFLAALILTAQPYPTLAVADLQQFYGINHKALR